MKAKVARIAVAAFMAVSFILAAVPVTAGSGVGSLAAEMSSVAQLCIGDGGGSGGG